MTRFCRYELRTTDIDAAHTFYTQVFGEDFWSCEVLSVAHLPARAAAAGAPAHWLGHIGVADVEGTAKRVVELGGQTLGPIQQARDGSYYAALKDPFGAVLAVGDETPSPENHPIAWHFLNTTDRDRALAIYAELFGWAGSAELIDLGSEMGQHQMFAWDHSSPPSGSIANTALLPNVHTHWAFCFRVDDIREALAKVNALGGKTLEPRKSSTGDLVAPCDDALGAAFALYQSARLKP